jgi:hypothetical protein
MVGGRAVWSLCLFCMTVCLSIRPSVHPSVHSGITCRPLPAPTTPFQNTCVQVQQLLMGGGVLAAEHNPKRYVATLTVREGQEVLLTMSQVKAMTLQQFAKIWKVCCRPHAFLFLFYSPQSTGAGRFSFFSFFLFYSFLFLFYSPQSPGAGRGPWQCCCWSTLPFGFRV